MKYLYYIIFLFFVLTACKDKDKPVPSVPNHYVKINVHPKYGTETLYLDSVFQTAEGYDIKFTDIKFYLQDVKNGSSVLSPVGLFDYRVNGVQAIKEIGTRDNFSSLTANLGVDSSINHNDPTDFSNSSPLNISNANDMHWGWNPGYIFVKVEAKADTLQDGIANFDQTIVFHIGLDENLQTLNFSNLNWTTVGDEDILDLKLDMQSFLVSPQSIDVKTEFTCHSAVGQEILATKVITNFKNAISPL